MLVASIVLAILGSGQAPTHHEPLADADFIRQAAAVELDWKNATDFFVVAPATATKPTGKIASALERVMPSLKEMAAPALGAELRKAKWTAFRDVSHRVEPLIASCSLDRETIYWSFGEYVAAMLVDLPAPVDLGDVEKANSFAKNFLAQHLSLPERPNCSFKFYIKSSSGIWGGYVDRLSAADLDGTELNRHDWDMYFLIVTDGSHVLVRWNLADLEKVAASRKGGYAHGPVPKKSESRFDE